jgi:hypothetical protein
MEKTVFVLVSDYEYFWKATVTINDLKTIGNWNGDLVLITINFNLDEQYKIENNIIELKFPIIDKSELLIKIGPNGFRNSDKRELNKLNQWEKLHVFDDYFLNWNRVVFLDAGLRVLDDVIYILELDYKNKLLAPIDGKQLIQEPNAIFKYQLEYDNVDNINLIKHDFGENIFNQTHMLNCMWIYDTNILKICNKTQLINAMNTYPVCRTNEMGIMNLLFHFKYKLWEKFPPLASNGKYLFEWCESNNNFNTTWQNYCFLKYPITIALNEKPLNEKPLNEKPLNEKPIYL